VLLAVPLLPVLLAPVRLAVPLAPVPLAPVPVAPVPVMQRPQRRLRLGRVGQPRGLELGAQPVHVGQDLAA
jgi:hypothetical protein